MNMFRNKGYIGGLMMEENVSYVEDIIKELEKKYCLTDINIKFINGFENLIYECEIDGVKCILRLSDSEFLVSKCLSLELLNYLKS